MTSSYRQMLRSSSIIGGASVINIAMSLVRTKVAAVLLGPAGVGLIGLFQNLIATASSVAAMGIGVVGTRQIAEAVGNGDEEAIAASRRALAWGTLFLALIGLVGVWLMRETLATHLLGDANRGGDVGWLAIGVSLTVGAGSQGALLNGLRRIGDIARISVWSSVMATVLGIGALRMWGFDGLLAFVLAAPLASLVLGHMYVARLPKLMAAPTQFRVLASQWATLLRLGAAFMISGALVTAGQLAVRSMIQHDLGAAALGQFQAAWAISMTYIGFVLGAMGTDYYPRLTAVIHDRPAVNRLVNEQTEVALLLSGPIFIAMLALAPWVITLLYSSSFGESAVILRWQILGDVLKVAGWPMGYILVAAGDGRTFMLTEALSIAIFTGLVWLGLPMLGVQVTGAAFLAMYAVHLPLMYGLAWRRTGFIWSPSVRRYFTVLLVAASTLVGVGHVSEMSASLLGVPISIGFAAFAMKRLAKMSGLTGPIAALAVLGRSKISKTDPEND